MPNIGTLLKAEITRLSRKEARSQIDPTKKSSAQQRKDIAALKRQVANIERQVAMLARKALVAAPAPKSEVPATRIRFTAKGLRAQREGLWLSADDFGKLLGVSAQSVYNWELEKARPRAEQLAKIAALRGIGKREAAERVKQLEAK
jgi:DNA-binding transcriptional regulator YiaG